MTERSLLIVALLALGASGCKLLAPGGDEYDLEQLVCTQRVTWGVPRGVSVKDGGVRDAALSWHAPEKAVHRYRIERSETPEGPFGWISDVPGNRLLFVDGHRADKRLKDGTTYYYKICAVLDKKGTMSEFSAVVKTTTAPLPPAPTNLKATASGSRAVTLSWSAPLAEGIVRYSVQRTLATEPEAFKPVGESATTQLVDGGDSLTLKDSTRYLYRVVAVNRGDGASEPSAQVAVETLPPPAPPRKLTAVANQVRCVSLAWEPSPEADVVHYDIYQGREERGPYKVVGTTQGRSTVTFIDGGGNPGTLEDEGTYFYRVRAVNAVTAESADSQTVCATTRTVPPVVAAVVTVSGKPREIPITWAPSPDDSVVGYELWRTRVDQDDWQQIARFNSRGETTHIDRGGQGDASKLGNLEDGTEYNYRVVAFNTAGVRSSGSEPVVGKTKVLPLPPTGLQTTTGVAHEIQLSWLPNAEKDVNGYVVEVSKKADGGFRKLTQMPGGGSALTAQEVDLEPSTIRYFRVKALDREGIESLWSEVVQGSSKPLPDAPKGLKVTSEGNSFKVSWVAPPQRDVAQYHVYAKRTLSWELRATTELTEFLVPKSEVTKAVTYAVTAVDGDKLESVKSEQVKME